MNSNPYEIKGEPHLSYRPDIDGLRALAVLSVVIGHAFPALLPGGFIGVDVFYVISGYLISGIILKDLELGRFTFRKFFAHRFRRIIPALSVVLMAVWIAGWFILLPDEYLTLGRHIAVGAVYLSNGLLWLEAGYFDPSSSLKPLLHLWSLGVEEQFYFVWPILLVFAFRKKLSIGKLVAMLAIISFMWNVVRVEQHSTEVFYLLPSRFWELLAGAGLAYSLHQKKKIFHGTNISHLSSWVAAILFLAGLVWIDRAKAFPGYWALIPVIAAVLFILAGPRGWVNQYILSSRPAVFIGLISFPLYLWHWPILAFLHIVQNDKPSSPVLVSALMMMAVGLAWITWKWIELPIRSRIFLKDSLVIKERKYLRAGFAAIVFTCLVGVLTRANHGFEFRIEGVKNYYAQTAWGTSADKTCQDKFGYPLSNFCKANSLVPELLVLGDSHANHLYPGLANSSQFKVLNIGQCVPLDSVEYSYIGVDNRLVHLPCLDVPKIWDIQKKVLADTPSIKTVVLAARWSHFLPGKSAAAEVAYSSTIDSSTHLSQEQIFENGLSRTIDYIESKGKKAIFFLDNPEMNFHISTCVARPYESAETKGKCGISRAEVMERQAAIRKVATHLLARHPGLRIFDPVPILCKGDSCPAIEEGKLIYRDIHHLSFYGSDKVAQAFLAWLKREGSNWL